MSADQLEQRLAAVEQTVAAIQQQLAAPGNGSARPFPPPAPTTQVDDETWEKFQAICRYIRKTGEEPPPGWNPGDPIPDPEWWS